MPSGAFGCHPNLLGSSMTVHDVLGPIAKFDSQYAHLQVHFDGVDVPEGSFERSERVVGNAFELGFSQRLGVHAASCIACRYVISKVCKGTFGLHKAVWVAEEVFVIPLRVNLEAEEVFVILLKVNLEAEGAFTKVVGTLREAEEAFARAANVFSGVEVGSRRMTKGVLATEGLFAKVVGGFGVVEGAPINQAEHLPAESPFRRRTPHGRDVLRRDRQRSPASYRLFREAPKCPE